MRDNQVKTQKNTHDVAVKSKKVFKNDSFSSEISFKQEQAKYRKNFGLKRLPEKISDFKTLNMCLWKWSIIYIYSRKPFLAKKKI